MPWPPRRFTSLTRTPTHQGFTVLDAIDTDDWTELKPLPAYEAKP